MKHTLKIIAIVLLLPFSSWAQTDKIAVQVDGLGCPFCAFGLEKKMKKIDNINHFTIDMETGLTEFEVPTEQKISAEQIDALVTDGGYSAMHIKIERANGEKEDISLEVPKAEDASTKLEFYVNGSCDMCESRIVRTAYRSGGVGKAEWNKKKKVLKLLINEKMTDQKKIETALAAIGYDTANLRAEDSAYEKLPECCQYKRKK